MAEWDYVPFSDYLVKPLKFCNQKKKPQYLIQSS